MIEQLVLFLDSASRAKEQGIWLLVNGNFITGYLGHVSDDKNVIQLSEANIAITEFDCDKHTVLTNVNIRSDRVDAWGWSNNRASV